MKLSKRDEALRRRYEKLSSADQAKVDQIIKRHKAACMAMRVEPDIDGTFREAIDIVSSGMWEPDAPVDRPEHRWQYQVYVSPLKEAA